MKAEALFRFCRLMFWKEGQNKHCYKTDLENSRVNDDVISHITVCLRYAPVDNLVISVLAVFNGMDTVHPNNLSENQNPNSGSHLPLSDSHPVVVHLVNSELLVGI